MIPEGYLRVEETTDSGVVIATGYETHRGVIVATHSGRTVFTDSLDDRHAAQRRVPNRPTFYRSTFVAAIGAYKEGNTTPAEVGVAAEGLLNEEIESILRSQGLDIFLQPITDEEA